MDFRIVNVIPESSVLRQQRMFRSFFSMSDHMPRITFAELYETLAHGEPGDYILVGA